MWFEKWVRTYLGVLLRHRLLALVVVVLTTAILAPLITRVRITARLSDYYPTHHPYVQLYQRFTEMLKFTNAVMVMLEVKEGTIYTPEVMSKIHRITVDLIETKGVNPFDVMSLTHPRLQDIRVGGAGIQILPVVDRPEEPKTRADLEKIKNAVYTNTGIRGFYVSEDDKTTLIRAGFWDGMADPRAVAKRLQAITEREQDANTRIYITGQLMLAAWLIRYAPQFLLLLGASILATFLLLWALLGSLKGALIPLLSSLVAVMWALGGAGVLGLTLEPLALLVFFPLFARAVSHTMVWVERYRQEYRQQPSPFQDPNNTRSAAERTGLALFRPATLALVADIGGLLAISFSDLPMIQKLAYLGLFWLTGLLVSTWTLTPLFLSWLQPWGIGAQRRWGERFIDACTTWLSRLGQQRILVNTGVALLLVAGGVGALGLEAGRAMLGTTLFPPAHPYNLAFARASTKFMGVNQLVVIATAREGSSFRQLEALNQIEALQKHMAYGDHFGVSLAVTDLAKGINQMFHEGIPKWAVLPDDTDGAGQIIFRIVLSAAAPGEVERFLSPDLSTVAITVLYRDYAPEIVTRTIQRAQTFVSTHPSDQVDFHLAGGIFGMLFAMNSEIFFSYWHSLFFILLITLLLYIYASGSLATGLQLILPLVLSQAVVLAALFLGGIDLNIYTLPVILLSIGTGIDPCTYLWETRERSRARGRAAVITALILIPTSLLWLLSPLRFQTEMGALLALLFFGNVFLSLTLIPAPLHLAKPSPPPSLRRGPGRL
jgi:predicted RND superfamily exporter protein